MTMKSDTHVYIGYMYKLLHMFFSDALNTVESCKTDNVWDVLIILIFFSSINMIHLICHKRDYTKSREVVEF